MKKRILYVVLAGIIFTLTGCSQKKVYQESIVEQAQITEDEIAASDTENDDMEITVWSIYWDTDDTLEEIDSLQNEIDHINYFAAYFDASDDPFIPEQSLQTKTDVEKRFPKAGWDTYLTFVNDRLLENGGSSLKDTQLLYTLLQDDEVRKNHIDQILNMVTDNDFDGIEIDYEAIKKDMDLWQIFITFIDELNTEAAQRNIKIRVLLEPGAPFDEITFPKGPEYVLMCYNLYGYGTEPGPKADKDFIKEMADKMSNLPEPYGMAFSVGGFDFSNDGSVKQLTEYECVSLQVTYDAEINRDDNSQDVVFTYNSEDGIKHEVWYADSDTLKYWIETAGEFGIKRFSIWRLGSNITIKDLSL